MQSRNTVVRDELRAFCRQWGISQRPESVARVMHAYLACSLALREWQDVYVEIFGSADMLLLDAKRAAYPGPSAAESFNKRARDANVYATIFSGTLIPSDEALEANPTYMAFRKAVVKAMHPYTVGHINVLTIMHLVGDVRDLSSLMEDPALGFKVKLPDRVSSLHKEVAQAVWKFDAPRECAATFAHDMASIITGCCYDGCLSGITVDDVWSGQQQQQQQRGQRRQGSSSSSHEQRVTTTATSLQKTQFPRHEPLPWDMVFERSVADDPRFMTLKKVLGKPVFCNNKQMAQEYLVYATVGDANSPTTNPLEQAYRADFASIASEDELCALLSKFAERMNASVVCELDDVAEFERILIQYGSPTQQLDWTTRELLVHLFMAYHPKWKQFYSGRWNHDKPLLDAVETYLKTRPSISPLIAIGMFL